MARHLWPVLLFVLACVCSVLVVTSSWNSREKTKTSEGGGFAMKESDSMTDGEGHHSHGRSSHAYKEEEETSYRSHSSDHRPSTKSRSSSEEKEEHKEEHHYARRENDKREKDEDEDEDEDEGRQHLDEKKTKIAFNLLDANADGHISKRELKKILIGRAADDVDVDEVVDKADDDSSESLEYQEFRKASQSKDFRRAVGPSLAEAVRRHQEKMGVVRKVREQFQAIDKNEDGNITPSEVGQFFERQARKAARHADENGDDKIQVGEFADLWAHLM